MATTQEDIYPTATGDPKTLYSIMARSIRDLALEHMLAHRSTFESSFGRRSAVITTTDLTTANTEMDMVTENEPEAIVEMERDALASALDPDLDHYCNLMRSEIAQGDELTIRDTALVL